MQTNFVFVFVLSNNEILELKCVQIRAKIVSLKKLKPFLCIFLR